MLKTKQPQLPLPFLHFPIHGLATDSESAGRGGYIAIGSDQRLFYHL